MFLILLSTTIVAITLFSSGFLAPALSILILVPVLAAFFLGLKACVAYSVFSLFFLTLGFTLEVTEILPSHGMNAEQWARAKFFAFTCIILASFYVAAAYERNREETEKHLGDLNDKLEIERNKAQQSLAAKSQFLANVSHEIRTPLNGILGMVTILGDAVEDKKVHEYLKTIEFSGESLLIMVNDLLDQAKLESGKFELEYLPFDPVEQIENVVEVFKNKSSTGEVDIRLETVKPINEKIMGDAVRFSQVLFNLVGNAVKFSNNKPVSVRIAFKETEAEQCEVSVYVIDQGIGISDEVQAKLFTPFAQADASTTREYGGTGLGLSICKGILENMGGDIRMQSELGRGSTFSFCFNTSKVKHAHPATAQQFENAGQQLDISSRLLVAEDNSVNRSIVQAFLQRLGYSADFVEDGQEAVEAVKKKNYDVLLMDCHMPRLDGFQATREIIDQCGDIRPHIIALTASAQKSDRDMCEKAGMDGFISKPLRMEDLQHALLQAQLVKQGPESQLSH